MFGQESFEYFDLMLIVFNIFKIKNKHSKERIGSLPKKIGKFPISNWVWESNEWKDSWEEILDILKWIKIESTSIKGFIRSSKIENLENYLKLGRIMRKDHWTVEKKPKPA